MSDTWWFKAFGEEFGPLQFSDLIEAARRGTLAPADVVRSSQQESWGPAEDVPGLFRSTTQDNENEDSWVVDVVGQMLGPLSLAHVAAMIRERKLLPTDRIRHANAAQWQSIGAILNRMESAGHGRCDHRPRSDEGESQESRSIATSPNRGSTLAPEDDDGIERLILEVLAAPVQVPARPSLAELGLAGENSVADREPVPIRVIVPSPIAEASRAVLPSSLSRWRLNPFRPAKHPSEPDESKEVDIGEEHKSAEISILPVKERSFSSSAQISSTSSEFTPRRLPWLELLLVVGSTILVLQFLPGVFSRLVAFTDIRGWSLRDWIIVQVALIAGLAGFAVRERRALTK